MSIGKLAGDARTYRDRSSNRTAWVDRPHVAEIAHICEFRDGAADAEKQQIRQPAPRPIPIGFPLANSRCPLGVIRRQSLHTQPCWKLVDYHHKLLIYNGIRNTVDNLV